MGLSDYIKKKQGEQKPKATLEPTMTTEEAIDRYSKLDEVQLMQELFKVGSVSSGKVSAQELDEFYGKVKGFLSPEQTAKMQELIRQLKNN